MGNNFRPVVTIFHCINTLSEVATLFSFKDGFKMRSVRMPCSSTVKDVFLLRAFEAGADAVVVLACPEGECHYVDGNRRARKRVERLKDLLDEIGLDGRRLSLFNVSLGDEAAVTQIIQKIISDLNDLGPNPAMQICNESRG
jgi:coenzyme F420-reducing hydrogenase delta subunit